MQPSIGSRAPRAPGMHLPPFAAALPPAGSSSAVTIEHSPDFQPDSTMYLDDAPPPNPAFEEASLPLVVEKNPPPNPPPVAEEHPSTQITASGRASRVPAHFRDELPQAPPVIVQESNAAPTAQILPRIRLFVRDKMSTSLNPFRLYRHYLHRPSYDPDSVVEPEDLCNRQENFSPADQDKSTTPSSSSKYAPPWPFSNMSKWLVMTWQNSGGSRKSQSETTRLVNEFLLHPEFRLADLVGGFNAHTEDRKADEAMANASKAGELLSQFKKADVTINVPSGQKNVPPQPFNVPGLYYQDLLSTIQTAFTEPLGRKFHFSPFRLFHQLPDSEDVERVYSELYNSDDFIEEHDRVQRLPLAPEDHGCKLERVVAGLMFWSDSTHLANFGTAKLWPIYMMFGNLSKYVRSSPTSGACHHVAYIPSLPDTFHDFASSFHPKWKSQKADILTHCRRELMHAVWQVLLDDAFIHAYKYGIVIECADGIKRRVYPRIFTYSADYPEKVLLATMRDKGLCPCPRCMVQKSDLDKLGFVQDMRRRVVYTRNYLIHSVKTARRFIYDLASPIKGVHVERLLKPSSSVPTLNAFVDRIGLLFNPNKMLAVDLLHEFELGVWKAVFTHLIRILYSLPDGAEKVAELDRRFRQIPAFGNSTIRHFVENASEMKKLAGRDYEDLLQCAIPAFEGLLPESHDTKLTKLLFRLAQWHALAKLRQHTDSTIEELRKTTVELGKLLREFRDSTATEFKTYELPREQEARRRREERTQQSKGGDNASSGTRSGRTSTRKPKGLNIDTVKFHFLGDYPQMIKTFGTTDNYSTQAGELAHRHVKQFYDLSNRRNATDQVARRYQRQRTLQNQAEKDWDSRAHQHLAGRSDARLDDTNQSHIPPEVHHVISESRNHPIHLDRFLHSGTPDPAKKARVNFVRKLKEHVLGRLRKREFDGDTHDTFTDEDRNQILITNNKIYAVKTLRVNFTTYDVRRDQDVVNPSTDRNAVMVPSPERRESTNAHPYWYARVLGLFHADIIWFDPVEGKLRASETMEFLWVRWLGDEPGYRSGLKFARLPKIGFVPDSDEYAFGFLDPAVVIRACHLIPDFNSGRTSMLLDTAVPTAARHPGE
ncbi:hypothetical protein V5O48_017441, partial [Marasmius crinis-equi]